MSEGGDRTEPGTPRRRQQARENGQAVRSVELVSAVLLFTVLLMLFKLSEKTGGLFVKYFNATAARAHELDLSEPGMQLFIREQVTTILEMLAPYLLASVAVALAMNFLQVGLLTSTKAIAPDFGKLNPLKGLQRMFSMRGMVELLKSLLKLGIIGTVGASIICGAAGGLLQTIDMEPLTAVAYTLSIGLRIALTCSVLLLVIAALDWAYQKYEFEKSIRMSKQEIREEFKNMEGDPQVKRKIRDMGRRIATGNVMSKLKLADVIITNPTHYAVALQYEADWPAPKVVAKGVDFSALRIIRYAESLNIPVYQQPPLARELYKTDLEQYIPPALFRTVAQVLAHISRHDRRLRGKLTGAPVGTR